METKQVNSLHQLLESAKAKERSFLLFYKDSSDSSLCALNSLSQIENQEELTIFTVDVSTVKDIHPHYAISSVPTLLELGFGQAKNMLKGCNKPEQVNAWIKNALYSAAVEHSDKHQKSVVVYTTPSCPWCTTLKNHLRQNGIRYEEIDVASDANAAEEMTRKSGQRGVPQCEIEGEMIVGFDKAKINRLLDISKGN